jgi:quercetin dioxygenase-like cupin family protein
MQESNLDAQSRIGKKKDLIQKPMDKNLKNYSKVEYYPLITSRKDDAPNFSMRLFKIGPGGYTNKHKHSYEHEVYILKGKGHVILDNEKLELESDSFFIIHPYELHQFYTEEGLEFICVVPNKLKNYPD